MDKQCSKCKEWKPFSEFHIDKTRKDGYTYRCKQCTKKYQKIIKDKRKKWAAQYYLDNREVILKKEKEYRLKNPEQYRQKQKESYYLNRDKRLIKQAEYRKKNPKKITYKDKIYSFLYGKTNPTYKGYLQGDGCCLYCGEINPFMLENHHVWGVNDDPDFTITLCANHHKPFIRFPKMMENWGEPIFP